ncbi:unnamed protein product [Paramecium pentaurelia]|uniref:Uncharacterized protein n=1 Tax=Paramecium pentaurelia TaxID=43138 RepID=A0A8S1U1X7_9CILI|nr:unnamed protein product [Paramecium pentaurelia]
MSNEAVAGFIAIKTLQNRPLRYFDANFNEFRDKNMTMYIQKKYADLKKRTGVSELPFQTFSSTQLQIKPKANDGLKEVKANYELDEKVIEIMQKVIDQEELEGILQQCQGQTTTNKQKNWKKKAISVPQKLALLMNDQIEQADLDVLFNQYQRQNLKSSLDELKMSVKDPKLIYKKLGKEGFQKVEFNDQEQVNFFMKKLCEEQKLDACSVLEIRNENIKFKEDACDEMERWRNIVQKRITQEQMQKILIDEEMKQNKQLVQIFKDTRIDQFDPDFFKKKVKSKTMKRVNEAQDSQYHKFFVQTDTNKATFGKDDFLRKKFNYTTPKSKVENTLRSTRPTTSVSRSHRVLHRSDIEFNKFIKQCNIVEHTFQQSNTKLNERFQQMDKMMDKACQYLEDDKPQEEKEPNQDFERFKKQRLFKKKFVTYLIDKVEKQSDLLSQKIKTVQSKKLIEKVLSEDL